MNVSATIGSTVIDTVAGEETALCVFDSVRKAVGADVVRVWHIAELMIFACTRVTDVGNSMARRICDRERVGHKLAVRIVVVRKDVDVDLRRVSDKTEVIGRHGRMIDVEVQRAGIRERSAIVADLVRNCIESNEACMRSVDDSSRFGIDHRNTVRRWSYDLHGRNVDRPVGVRVVKQHVDLIGGPQEDDRLVVIGNWGIVDQNRNRCVARSFAASTSRSVRERVTAEVPWCRRVEKATLLRIWRYHAMRWLNGHLGTRWIDGGRIIGQQIDKNRLIRRRHIAVIE